MAISDYQLADAYFGCCPETFKALQKVVTSAAKISKTVGKKGLLGGDKHEKALPEFLRMVQDLCNAIDVDGGSVALPLVSAMSCAPLSSDGNHLRYADELIGGFKECFPNWTDAYVYWDAFYKRSQEQGKRRL